MNDNFMIDGGRALLLALFIAWGLSLMGCEEGLPEVTPEEGSRVLQVAEPAANALLRTLVDHLTTALEDGGPREAAEFCSIEAMPLTRMSEAGLEQGMALKRTSFRYRNPDNAPDQAEEMALRYFEEAILDGGPLPAHFIQRVSEEELRYYKPLLMGEFCLHCHGDPEALDPGVQAILEATYPGDLATGYQAGDFRGVVRVSVPARLVQE
jgi:hypothetical protein